MKRKLMALLVEDGSGSGVESHRKKKRKSTATLPALGPSQTVQDCGPVTGSLKKTILKCQELQAGNGAEPDRKKKKKKKKVSFQLPDPPENELLGEGTETQDVLSYLESPSWSTDKLRPGLVYGEYTAVEDGALKQAIFDYIQEHGWNREDGLEKILNSRSSEARGCWHVIRKCLPQRELKLIYSRAHRILGAGTNLGKWTSEEIEALIGLHSVHGNDWKRISTIIGRMQQPVRTSGVVLNILVLKVIKQVRDDINWDFIAEQMEGRGRLDCLTQWYRRMASPMVASGEWSNGDDQRILSRLLEEFPLSEELVEWDSLLKHRSGETCKRRWEQMQRTLGRGAVLQQRHFLEKLEGVIKLFAPHLLDAEYDQQFAEKLQAADADDPEDLDT